MTNQTYCVASEDPGPSRERADGKKYNRTKILVSFFGSLLFFALAIVVLATGFSNTLSNLARSWFSNDYLALLAFVAIFGVIESAFGFPISFYSGYYLEHKYQLSNQTLARWVWEGVKGMLIGIVISVPIILLFFYFLRNFGSLWWLPVSAALFFFSVILARLAPIVIMPLFYKFKPLEDGTLKERIINLCRDAGMAVGGVFTFNMSKNTKKANAGFTGIGKSKRIILGDTLMERFTEDEIETVFAHELGHYKHGHIWKGVVAGAVSIFLGLFITTQLYKSSLHIFGFHRIDDIAALPLLTLWLALFGFITTPLTNIISRRYEHQADKYALEKTRNAASFISTMKKLAGMNLADVRPNPIIEFLFYSHPSIEKRIGMSERYASNGRFE
jgi:STE24 endopeptidase